MFSFFWKHVRVKPFGNEQVENKIMHSWQLLIYNTMNFVSVCVCLVGLMVRVTGWIHFSHVDQAVIQIFWKVIGATLNLSFWVNLMGPYRLCTWPSFALTLTDGHDHQQGACDNWFCKDTWHNCLKNIWVIFRLLLNTESICWQEYNGRRRSNRKQITIL